MSAHTERTTIDGPHGRLELEMAGPADGQLVIFHHGSPSCGRLFGGQIEDGAQRGLRQASYSRPGYAGSDRRPGRSVADCVPDTAAVADALGAERFFCIGHSGGGPHALACAALLPERVIAAASIAGVAPHDAEGLDWSAGMGEENVSEFSAALTGEDVLRTWMAPVREEMLHVTGHAVQSALGDLLSEVDKRALTGSYADYVARCFRAGLAPGPDGWVDDDLAFLSDWGFPLQFSVPVTIWQGTDDRMVPFAHGEWLADHAAGATARLLEDEGHLSLALVHYGEVLDELLAAAS